MKQVTLEIFRAAIGKAITQRREEEGWNVVELANRAEISPTTMYNIEAGRSDFKIDKFFTIADALNTCATRLLSSSCDYCLLIRKNEE